MKTKKIVLSSAAVLGIAGVIAAYILTDNSPDIKSEGTPQNGDESVEIYHPVVTSEPEETAEITPEPVYYMVVAEENKLCLYEIEGDRKKVVKSSNIALDIFPEEDIELLKNGIHALSLEEGVEIMENFIS